jgi:hypothetical protein
MTCLILGDNPFEILFFGLKQPRVKSPQDRFSPTGLGRLIDRGGQFTKSRSSETAEATWRADNNHVEQFLSECVYQNAYDRIAVQTLYDPYTGWFQSTGLRGQLGRLQFCRRVEAAGVPKRRMSEGHCFIGISLR